MLRKRVIPVLLLHKGELYKTKRFRNHIYIGDPFNAFRIFNEKEADELVVLDIDASRSEREPDYRLIENIASECFMPLCYGGGIKNIEQMKRIYSSGVEKISISSAAIHDPNLISQAAKLFGSQSVVVTIDYRRTFWGKHVVFTHNGKVNTKLDLLSFAKMMEEHGAGEIIVNSIGHDGMMSGFDLDVLAKIKREARIPIVAMGGCGSRTDISNAFEEAKVDAVACGSLFVFKGKLNGVLINYDSQLAEM